MGDDAFHGSRTWALSAGVGEAVGAGLGVRFGSGRRHGLRRASSGALITLRRDRYLRALVPPDLVRPDLVRRLRPVVPPGLSRR